ncbi:hypothetical protein D9M71_810110 [compost metagenome]
MPQTNQSINGKRIGLIFHLSPHIQCTKIGALIYFVVDVRRHRHTLVVVVLVTQLMQVGEYEGSLKLLLCPYLLLQCER